MSGPSVEIQFAQKLAANEVVLRDKALKKLKKWLGGQRAMSPQDMLRLWKGLYYCFWMSDKPLVQEELSEKISELVNTFPSGPLSLLYMESFLKTMNREWFGIDRWRTDKFLMLSRRSLRANLLYLKRGKSEIWELLPQFMEVLHREILAKPTGNDLGFRLHFIEIFFEEVAKVGGRDFHLPTSFLEVFVQTLAFTSEPRIRDHIVKYVFHYLMKQSDIALAYEAFRRGEIPSDSEEEEGDEEEMEEGSSGDEDENDVVSNGVLDPRAGKVDVTLSQIILDYSQLGDLLFDYGSKKEVRRVNRGTLYTLSKQCKAIAEDSYPFAVIEDEEDIQKMKKELNEINVDKLASDNVRRELESIKRNTEEKKAISEYVTRRMLLNGQEEEDGGEESEDLEGEEMEDMNVEESEDLEGEELNGEESEDLEGEESEDLEGEESEDLEGEESEVLNGEESEDLDDEECEDLEGEELNGDESEDLDGEESEDLNGEESEDLESEESEEVLNGEESEDLEGEESNDEEPIEEPIPEIGKKRKRTSKQDGASVKQKRLKLNLQVVPPPSKKKMTTNVQNEDDESEEALPPLSIKLKGKSKKFKVASKNKSKKSSPSLFDDNNDWNDGDEAPRTPSLPPRITTPAEVSSESKVHKRMTKKERKLSLPSSKKVNFVMTKNKHQTLVQHHKSIVSSPEIPFVPHKQPRQGVLKVKGDVTPTTTPPNPKVLARNTIINAKSKAAKLLLQSRMSNFF